MEKKDVLKLLHDLIEPCAVMVNMDNMERYDESPDDAVDHSELMKRIEEAIEKGK